MENKSFQIVYARFVDYLKHVIGTAKVNQMTHHNPIFSEYGPHFALKAHFEDFLKLNPEMVSIMKSLKWKFYPPENICEGKLHFPVDTTDENDLVTAEIRKPSVEPRDPSIWKKGEWAVKNMPNGRTIVQKEGRKGVVRIYLYNNKKSNDFKTTHSIPCEHNEVGSIVHDFAAKHGKVKKFQWYPKY